MMHGNKSTNWMIIHDLLWWWDCTTCWSFICWFYVVLKIACVRQIGIGQGGYFICFRNDLEMWFRGHEWCEIGFCYLYIAFILCFERVIRDIVQYHVAMQRGRQRNRGGYARQDYGIGDMVWPKRLLTTWAGGFFNGNDNTIDRNARHDLLDSRCVFFCFLFLLV